MKVINIGGQHFDEIRIRDSFYVDKTYFIKQWWENDDEVTLITRPRRFGKTLTMSMCECFFSEQYAGRGELFRGLSIWEDEEYRKLQGTFPVISISFASVKSSGFDSAIMTIKRIFESLYEEYSYLKKSDQLSDNEKRYMESVTFAMDISQAMECINKLCQMLKKHHGVKPLVFIDEYDTPLQEAWLAGYWDKMVEFVRGFFNATLKTNKSLGRAIITGITRVSKESIFSDMNNLEIATMTSDKYADCFGFTEQEVFDKMREQGIDSEEERKLVKMMYDGFTIGKVTDIYNPWSITNYIEKRKIGYYWANSSSNGLLGKLLLNADKEKKDILLKLMEGGVYTANINEELVFTELDGDGDAIWSLMLATGYIKCIEQRTCADLEHEILTQEYDLMATNMESKYIFNQMALRKFVTPDKNYGKFIRYLLNGDIREMSRYMNQAALTVFSYMDTGSRASGESEPEKFYHAFVLGMLVELRGRYSIKSNRESGFGRYDVMLVPIGEDYPAQPGIIIEFKVIDEEEGEKTLKDTAARALKQIEEKKYETELLDMGIPAENIHKYAFAFRGKEVYIEEGQAGDRAENLTE